MNISTHKEDINETSMNLHACSIHIMLLPPATKLRQGYIFTAVCGGVHARGEACMAGGYAWPGGMHGGGMHGQGACVAGGGGMHYMHPPPPGRYYGYGIRSMSGRYASYWNAFLLHCIFANGRVSYFPACTVHCKL